MNCNDVMVIMGENMTKDDFVAMAKRYAPNSKIKERGWEMLWDHLHDNIASDYDQVMESFFSEFEDEYTLGTVKELAEAYGISEEQLLRELEENEYDDVIAYDDEYVLYVN